MSLIVVWMDLEHARLFEFSNEKMQRENFKASQPNHHTHHKEGDEKDSKKFYHAVAERMKDAAKILVIGPGLAKDHFKRYLEEHAALTAKRVIGYETVDHPTDHQIAALAMKYLQS